MNRANISEQLKRFGLSEKEISTYLAILNLGEAKPSTIAENTDVSKRYVYNISEQLEQRGFVEVNDHARPTTIRAIPPGEAIDQLVESAKSLQPSLESEYSSPDTQREEVEVLKSPATVQARLRDRLLDAREEVILSIPYSALSKVEKELQAIIDRGVLVLLLITGTNGETDGISRHQLEGCATVVRAWNERMPIMLSVDERTGMVISYDLISKSSRDDRAITIGTPEFVPILVGAFMGNYWPTADELYTTDPPLLPRTYTCFRHAITDAVLARRDDQDLGLEATVIPTSDGDDPRRISGEILEIKQSLVRPETSSFPLQNTFVLDTDEGEVTVGGQGAFIEDYQAEEVTLRRID